MYLIDVTREAKTVRSCMDIAGPHRSTGENDSESENSTIVSQDEAGGSES